MKRFIPILLLLGGFSSPAMADIIHTISASTQLRVDAAATDATRIGSTYSVQGTNITAGTMGGLGQANESTGVAATHSDGVYTVTTAGDAFSLTESFIAGDNTNAIGSGVDVSVISSTTTGSGDSATTTSSYGIVADMPAFGNYSYIIRWSRWNIGWYDCNRRSNWSNSWRRWNYSHWTSSHHTHNKLA